MRLALCPLIVLCLGCPAKPPPVVSVDDKVGVGVGADGRSGSQSTEEAVAELVANFARVHFDVDSSLLSPDARRALDANAAILDAHRQLTVEVQGHADERGTIDYNMALGQRRARAVVDYLVLRGVAPSRLPVISYGEEVPLVAETNETAWAANRRAEFRVLGAREGT